MEDMLDISRRPGLRTMSINIKKQANEVRSGNIIEIEGRLMQVIKMSHTQGVGRQLGNVQLELRDMMSRAKRPLRVRPSDTVDVVRLDERSFQYLYREGNLLYCMDPQSFDQVTVDADTIGPVASYLKEGGDLTLAFNDGNVVAAYLAPTVTLKVAEAAPHLKGDTASPQYVSVVLETGASASVPPYVRAGDLVVLSTTDGAFVKRA
jgi:translation elongation factor P